MPDQNPQNPNNSIDDFEMGGQPKADQTQANQPASSQPQADQTPVNQPASQTQNTQPQINRYDQNQQSASQTPTPQTPASQPLTSTVNPKDGTPLSSKHTPPNSPPSNQTSQAQGQKPLPPKPVITPVNYAARKKAIIGCVAGFGVLILIFLVLAFVFINQGEQASNPIAKLLGLSQATFVNSLITFIHIIFIILALFTFVFTMIGVFKIGMTKKDDKIARQEAIKSAIISSIALFFIIVIWVFVFIYLDTKKLKQPDEVLAPIITEPEETVNLSAPVEIKFDGSNIPISSKKYQIVSTDWDFGDGEKSTGQIVSHVYKEKGVYDVKLTVTVQDKTTQELSIGGEYHVTVSITNEALKADFSATPQSGEAPLKVEFDATKSIDPDGIIKTFEWDLDSDEEFDDAQGDKVEHTFDKIGKYKVSLRVTTSTDESDTQEKEIDVIKGELPIAVIAIIDEPKEFLTNISYAFKANDSTSPNGKIEKYEWNFGDGSKAKNSKSVSYKFASEGTYEVTLKVTDETGKEGTVTKKIIIGAPQGTPKANIITKPAFDEKIKTLEGQAPFTVVFDATNSTDSDNNIVDYNWDFDGDGTDDAFGETVNSTYNEEGSYNATLSVTDSDGNIGKTAVIIKVKSQGLKAILKADQVEGNVPLTVNFDASGSSYQKGKITTYKWDFGDGSDPKSGAAKISHKYTSIGNYVTSVQVIAADSVTDSAQVNISVREIPLQACFVSVFEKGPAPLQTTFDPGCSTGTIKSYFWDFGDGGTSTEVKPNHTYKDPGTYEVILEVNDSENTISKANLNIDVTS